MVLVCGGRDFSDEDLLYKTLDKVLEKYGDSLVVLHGSAKGADLMAEEWAKDREIPYRGVPAKWDSLGRQAGYERNARMRDMKPDACIAFKGNTGTKMMCDLMKKSGIEPWMVGWVTP